MENKKYLYYVSTNKFNYYVIATHPTEAKSKIEDMLNKEDYGYSKDREVKRIEQLASQILPALNSEYFLCSEDKLLM